MNEGDLFGYFASFLVFTTFYMKRMIPLRLTAIASNVAFISLRLARPSDTDTDSPRSIAATESVPPGRTAPAHR